VPGLPHHEQVVIANDPASGLRAVVALHSTALGPGLGGTRMYPYADDADALADALRLSRAMSYKNALAGLAYGGGKGVISGAPAGKTRDLLLAYGRLVASLNGRYVTACDVGTYVEDMDVIAEVCPYTTGRSPSQGGAGDSGILTAVGVFAGMRACADRVWGAPSLEGRTVGITGAGKVGRRLARHLADDGAVVLVTDMAPGALDRLRDEVPEARVVAPDALLAEPLDVWSPCAMGGAITADVAGSITAPVVCGGANNQLADPALADLLAARGVLYAPDFLVNSGGVIQVADEREGFDMDRARAHTERVYDTTAEVLDRAASEGVTPEAAAEAIAEARIAAGYARPGWAPFAPLP
jgi:valine dehydrogenase (NAD+)